MRYAIIIEKATNNYSAYTPDVPGCIATGATVEETVQQMREALASHFELMREDGDPVPVPETNVAYVDVPDSYEEAARTRPLAAQTHD
ncbi:MAG: type II toxin-antitoxin system HicB family antitoxin [Chloroflexota bacterium]|nr:type II toxin-antitoxin system HicB family antitoxin [Chloroflexota bacterium]